MIVVTDVKIIHVSDYQMTVAHMPSMRIEYAKVEGSEMPEWVPITEELITGKQFINANGERVNIGMSQQVQDAIGLPFESFDNMRKSLDAARRNSKRLNLEREGYRLVAEEFQTAGFFSRLKYLFTGKL